ncbi:MAG: helix-turn-helix transcriptional regulator, partial [Oscillospiraceae bacterium]|nr:helix-turn-helix transcriptional regulator [Oscillospiraceae bacterium]
MQYSGFLIRKERLAKNWSQEGLCKGICAVSYLSKIEQGKTEASEDILSALFARLGISWLCDK